MRFCTRLLLSGVLLFATHQDLAGRTWTDSSGTHRIEAEFVAVNEGQVKLRRSDGRVISVPVDKLSAEDQAHIASLAAPPADEPPRKRYEGLAAAQRDAAIEKLEARFAELRKLPANQMRLRAAEFREIREQLDRLKRGQSPPIYLDLKNLNPGDVGLMPTIQVNSPLALTKDANQRQRFAVISSDEQSGTITAAIVTISHGLMLAPTTNQGDIPDGPVNDIDPEQRLASEYRFVDVPKSLFPKTGEQLQFPDDTLFEVTNSMQLRVVPKD